MIAIVNIYVRILSVQHSYIEQTNYVLKYSDLKCKQYYCTSYYLVNLNRLVSLYYRKMFKKTKVFTLFLFAIIFCADAVEVTDEDINSPLVSYLLAKVQQLEAKMMVRPNIRNTRQTTDKPTKAPVVADNKQCNCPPSAVTYIRWGNSTCPYGADTIYSGIAAGSWYDHTGGAVDPLCLPPDPQYLLYKAGYQNQAQLFSVEYHTRGTPLDHSADRNMPCALCQVYGRTNKIMIPSHYECPSGWRREYYGYLMAGYLLKKLLPSTRVWIRV